MYSDVNKQLIQEGTEGSEEAGDAIKKIMPAYLEFKSSYMILLNLTQQLTRNKTELLWVFRTKSDLLNIIRTGETFAKTKK